MKKITFLLSLTLCAGFVQAQEFSETKAFEKAKKEGIAPVDYQGYIKREKSAFENKTLPVGKPFKGSYGKLFAPNTAARTMSASTCANLDFENLNFANWGIFTGTNMNSTMSPSNVVVDAMPYTSGFNNANGRHMLLDSANSFEIFSSISLLSNYPGKIITRLNDAINQTEACILERQFTVTSNQPFLDFSYAVFLEDAGHTAIDQPYLNIVMLDSTGAAIPGTSLSIIASQSVNIAFTQATIGSLNYFYKLWTPVTFNLSSYVGQSVTFQAIASDCTLGGHNGHAYFDFDCGGPLSGVANVWPGDANYDLQVNYLDLFYVGAGFGQTGSPRQTPGNTWASAASNNWFSNSLYLVDSKHADCDGNGTVGFSDTIAISQNYGLSHPFRSNSTENTTDNTTAPETIVIFPSANNIYAGQPFSIDFNLGSNSDLVDSIYAIGFSMDYPDQFLDNGFSTMDCSGSVIDNSNNNHLNLFKTNPGTAHLAMTRKNQLNAQNVQGSIFSLNLRAATIISADQIFNLAISDMKAITRSGSEIPLTANTYSIKFKASDATGIISINADNFSIFPNPATDKLNVGTPGALKIARYDIYSIDGKIVRSGEFEAKGNSNLIDVSVLDKGSYMIKLHVENGSQITKHFIKL